MTTKRKTLPVIAAPNPTRCHRIEDPELAASARHLDCQTYNTCLDLAARKDWRGFHCGGCGAYQAPTPLQRRRDMLGALRLLAETQVMSLLATGETVVDEEDEEHDDSVEKTPAAPSSAARRGTFLLDDDDTGAIPVALSATRAP
jgi:hypothetical protein